MLLVIFCASIIVATAAFLSLLESSIVAIDELQLVTMLCNRPANKESLKKVFHKKREHLSAIVLVNTLVSISGSTFLGALAAREANDLWLVIFTALLAYFMLVFAKILPKLLAVQIGEQVVVRWSPLIHLTYKLTRYFLQLALVWTRLLPSQVEKTRSSHELRSIIKHFSKRGVIGKRQRKLAEAVLTSDQRQLGELVENSIPAVCLCANTTVAAIEPTLRASPCKRYVVLESNQPLGVVLYRHLARALVNGEATVMVKELIQPVIHLKPDTSLNEAIQELHKARVSVILLMGESVEQTRILTAKKLYRSLLR